jgi:hypothetical protein
MGEMGGGVYLGNVAVRTRILNNIYLVVKKLIAEGEF